MALEYIDKHPRDPPTDSHNADHPANALEVWGPKDTAVLQEQRNPNSRNRTDVSDQSGYDHLHMFLVYRLDGIAKAKWHRTFKKFSSSFSVNVWVCLPAPAFLTTIERMSVSEKLIHCHTGVLTHGSGNEHSV